MPEPALVFWILGLPFIVAIVELVRTIALIRKTPNGARGIWSETLGVGGAARGSPQPTPASRTPVAGGRPSTLAPGLR